jgi:hypothetical protein
MTDSLTPTIEDFGAIAARMRELMLESEPQCLRCEDLGWVAYGVGRSDPYLRECPCCLNPIDRLPPIGFARVSPRLTL